MAGAFDCFDGVHRAQYFNGDVKDPSTTIERALRFGNAMQMATSSMQNSLFGDDPSDSVTIPSIPVCEPWNSIERLRKEKDVIGFYVSGHPLDEYRFEIRNFCNTTVEQLSDLNALKNREIAMAGILTEVNHRISKTGKPFGSFTIEDYTGLDGCGLVVKLTTGEVLEPMNLNDFNITPTDGMKVWVKYHEVAGASICMVGPIVEIDCLAKR